MSGSCLYRKLLCFFIKAPEGNSKNEQVEYLEGQCGAEVRFQWFEFSQSFDQLQERTMCTARMLGILSG
ncbi:hypothetical protein U0070_015024 [Myodes glareolus]|uniref:Uncharacterized protein n=1 Tax=Myodes glareolus TaxID=447135 RepID=A0AAW0I5Q5_MYOGA